MQCRPSDDDVRVVILARDRTRESENAAAAVKDGVRALRRKGARTKSEKVVFYFCLSFLFLARNILISFLIQYAQPSKDCSSQRNSVVI